MSGAAYAFLTLYKMALEVAEKQLSLFKTLKELRTLSPDGAPDLENRVKAIVAEALKQAVDNTVASVPAKVPEERINEIKVAMTKDVQFAIHAIVNGARVAITLESLDEIPNICENVPGLSPEKVNEMLMEQRRLESTIQQSLALQRTTLILPSSENIPSILIRR